jgi:DNA-binding NarL/FixJ family response regulator
VKNEQISIVIAEDKDVMRLGLQQLITAVSTFRVVGTAGDATRLEEVIASTKPNLLLIKDQLPGCNDLAALLRTVRELSPDTGVLVLLAQPEDFWGALDSRAQGYCVRDCSSEVLCNGLNTIAAGRCYIGVNLATYLLAGDGHRLLQSVVPRVGRASALDTLSRREKDVIVRLSDGLTNEEIARSLGLSIQTVKVHVKHILKKLQVSDRTQAVIKALKSG